MFHSMFTSHRFSMISNIVLALILALALIVTIYSFAPRSTPQTMAQEWKEGSNLEFDLRWGKGNRPAANNQANTIEVTWPQYPVQFGEEGSEFDLRWGKGKTPSVKGTNDFSYSYWLVVSPGGEKPVQIKP